MIKIKVKDIELTAEEAKELFEELKMLFGEKSPLPWDIPSPCYPSYPGVPYPSFPYSPGTGHPSFTSDRITICGD